MNGYEQRKRVLSHKLQQGELDSELFAGPFSVPHACYYCQEAISEQMAVLKDEQPKVTYRYYLDLDCYFTALGK